MGLALNPDGSEDKELHIKDLHDISVGNYHQDDFLNQKEDGEEALALAEAEAAKEKEHIDDILAEGDKDDEDVDLRLGPIFATDILHAPSSHRRLPAQDRYCNSWRAGGQQEGLQYNGEAA